MKNKPKYRMTHSESRRRGNSRPPDWEPPEDLRVPRGFVSASHDNPKTGTSDQSEPNDQSQDHES